MLQHTSIKNYFFVLIALPLVLFSIGLKAQCPVNIGNDTLYFCIGDTITLDAGTGFTSYTWSNSQSSQTVQINVPGIVSVTCSDGTNTCSDTITLLNYPAASVSLGPDDSLCVGQSITISVPSIYNDYVWQNGVQGFDTHVVALPGNYSITVTDTNGCVAIDSVYYGNYPVPTPNLGSDTTLCSGQTLLMSPGSFSSYAWNTGSAAASLSTDTAGFYEVTVTDGNGCQNIEDITVSVVNYPVVNLGADDSICLNQSKLLIAGIGFSKYTWSTGDTISSIQVSAPDIYWVEVENAAGCATRDSIEIHQIIQPVIQLPNDTAVCSGDSILLQPGNGTGYSYLWSTGALTNTLWAFQTDTFIVSVTDGTGCLNIDTFALQVNPLPVVNLGSDQYSCPNTTFSQSIQGPSGNANYLWHDGVITSFNTINHLDSVVWVEVTDNNGCVAADTLLRLDYPQPLVEIGATDTICEYENYTITATGGFSLYQWSTSSLSQSVYLNFNGANIEIPTDFTYAVTVTDANGCTDADTMTLSVFPEPEPYLGVDTSYCSGDPFSHTLDAGTYVQYLWSNGSNNQILSIGATPGNYSVTVTDNVGCVGNDEILVLEYAKPQPTLGNDTTYCEDSYVLNRVLNAGTYTAYAWSTGDIQKFIIIDQPGSYSVTVTDNRGCQNSDTITFIENPVPVFISSPDVLVCEDHDTIPEFILSMNPNYNYQWSNGANGPSIIVNDTGSYMYTVTDNLTGCFKTGLSKFEYFPIVVPDLGPDGVICTGQSKLLTPLNIDNRYKITWDNTSTKNNRLIADSGMYWVEYNAINGTCKGLRDTVFYSRAFVPTVSLGGDQVVCVGQSVTFGNAATAFPGATYTWHDGSTGPEYVTSETELVVIEVSNECGTAIDEAWLHVESCYEVFIPNAFTPNDDGRNDLYGPVTSQSLLEFKFWIYDREGSLVFRSNDINDKWDGKINGKFGRSGVYIFKYEYISAFDSERKRQTKTGHFTLVK